MTQLRLREIYPVYAVCDDGRIGRDLDGFPITDIADIAPSADLVIFVTSGFNEAMIAKLDRLGLKNAYRAADFGRFEPEKETYEFYREHKAEVENAYHLLKDDFSKRLFVNLINYRISRDPRYMIGMREGTPQYFPEEPDLRRTLPEGQERHIFLDLGAFDGDSIEGFLDYVNVEYDSIIAVESSEKNYKRLVESCRGLHDVECVNIGIADERKTMSFSISDAKNSFISENGESLLEVDSVDNILQGRKVSFIKMDIEGAEYDAIKGAKDTIRRNTPILAISVYHLTEDLFRLILEVENIAPGAYDYYMRHYSPTMIETIMYAVPKRKHETETHGYGQSI